MLQRHCSRGMPDEMRIDAALNAGFFAQFRNDFFDARFLVNYILLALYDNSKIVLFPTVALRKESVDRNEYGQIHV